MNCTSLCRPEPLRDMTGTRFLPLTAKDHQEV